MTADAAGLVVNSGVGTVYRLDAASGEVIWRVRLTDEALLPMGPYRKSGPVISSGPTVATRGILQGTCGGNIYRVDPASGEAQVVARLGEPIAAGLAPVGDALIACSAGVVIRRIRLC